MWQVDGVVLLPDQFKLASQQVAFTIQGLSQTFIQSSFFYLTFVVICIVLWDLNTDGRAGKIVLDRPLKYGVKGVILDRIFQTII